MGLGFGLEDPVPPREAHGEGRVFGRAEAVGAALLEVLVNDLLVLAPHVRARAVLVSLLLGLGRGLG